MAPVAVTPVTPVAPVAVAVAAVAVAPVAVSHVALCLQGIGRKLYRESKRNLSVVI